MINHCVHLELPQESFKFRANVTPDHCKDKASFLMRGSRLTKRQLTKQLKGERWQEILKEIIYGSPINSEFAATNPNKSVAKSLCSYSSRVEEDLWKMRSFSRQVFTFCLKDSSLCLNAKSLTPLSILMGIL